MNKAAQLVIGSSIAAGACIAGCSGNAVTLAPAPIHTPPDTSRLPAPFATLQFNILPIGPQITDGFDCPVGILTSVKQLPDAVSRRSDRRLPYGIFPITGGCDPTQGFPIVSPYPTPPGPTPTPLASATLGTAQITPPSLSLALPGVAGWSGSLAFPACPAGTCDAGTTNGTIALAVLAGTTASQYTFALSFTNVGPEHLTPPTPTPSEHPAPHIWNLYGPPPAPGATPTPHPTPTFLSGAPVALGFPSLTVTVPGGSGIDPSNLELAVSQRLTPPVYEIAIDKLDAAGDFLPIPLTSGEVLYHPYATTATTAKFALPSTPFAFQTDFTRYVFTLAQSYPAP